MPKLAYPHRKRAHPHRKRSAHKKARCAQAAHGYHVGLSFCLMHAPCFLQLSSATQHPTMQMSDMPPECILLCAMQAVSSKAQRQQRHHRSPHARAKKASKHGGPPP